MSWYKTGQIAVTNGSRVIVGVGTNFTRFVEVGEALLGPDGKHYEIATVLSATELRLVGNYTGETASAQNYAIMPVQSYVRDLAYKAADLIDAHRAVPAEALSYAESAERSAAEAQAAKIGLQEARDASAASATQAAISASEAAGAVAQVEDSASRAGASASQALSSAQSASASKADAEAAAVSAQNRAAAAAGSASSSASSASESAISAAKSAASATEAANSAAAAAVSSAQALTRANAAGVSASESEQASLAANAAKTSAQDFANAAAESASSSSAAAVFAEGLSVQANQSASSAAASALLAQNAKSSAQAEAALAQAAKTDAQTASNSASANAVNAAASADAASQSELASGMSEIAAAASEAAAHSAKVAAELANAAAASSAAESASSASAARASKEETAATASVVTEARDAALVHTATAKAWADKLDGEVEPGKYSARYWAEIIAGAATGGVVYMGTWSAAGGAFPSDPSRGHLYKVSVAGEINGVNYSVKDMIIFNGESWDKIDSTDEVTSVAGRVGAVLLTKADVGLENVDNTADLAKPVSAPQQAALNQKQDTLVSGESIKRLNGESLLGSGDVTISKSSLGLGNVDNTSDADKPVSTAQREALDRKQDTLVSGENIKTINGMSMLGGGDIVITNGDELAVPRLNSLLVYYGYPIAYKGIWNADAIVAEISASHDYWIVGHTYQDPAHEEYASTVAIMRGVRAAGVKLYGYIPLGVNSYNYTVAQIEAITDQWMAIGVDGIFIDEYGFDYGNTRQRQVDVVNMIHTKGLPICANAWVMEEFVTDSLAETGWPSDDWRYVRWQEWNPTNIPSPAQQGDSYLFENFCYDHLGPTAVWDTQERAEGARALALQNDVSVWGVAVFAETTPGTLDTAKLGNLATMPAAGEYISANAYLYDINVVGSGGFSFGSNGTPLWAPLRQLPESAQLPASPAENNYTDKTGVRFFGPVRVKVTNTATIQAVEVTDATPLRLGEASDGPGSGLDADLLDGKHLSDLLTKMPVNISGATTDFNSLTLSGLYNLYNTRSSTGAPPIDYGVMFVIGSNRAGSTFAAQIAIDKATGDTYTRGQNDTSTAWSAWQKGWNSNNDGAGSGLDADLLDGQHGSFYQNASNLTTGTVPEPRLPALPISKITDLQSALDGKAASSHTHAIANVTGLQSALDGKAAAYHGHTIADTSGLQAALDGKAAASHTHAYLPLTGGALSGAAIFNGPGNGNGVAPGNGDGCTDKVNNLKLTSWFGIGFGPSITGQPVPNGEYSHWFNVRDGSMGMRGGLFAWGNVTAFSDVRLKTDLTKIAGALGKVCALNGYTYVRKDTGERQTGVVAQEVQKVLPEAVIDNGEHLAVAYGNMVGLLIEAIKELKTEVDQLKGK